MNDEWTAALSEAVREVFENLCFMVPAEASVPPTEAPGEARILVDVDFSGARRGLLRLDVPDRMISTVASCMLGEDGPVELEEQYAAIGELANIVCGNALPRMVGERAVFDLAMPRVIATRQSESHLTFDAAATVMLDEGQVGASIFWQPTDLVGPQ